MKDIWELSGLSQFFYKSKTFKFNVYIFEKDKIRYEVNVELVMI